MREEDVVIAAGGESQGRSIGIFVNAEIHPPALIALRMSYTCEDAVWAGVCEELGTSTYGDDLDQVAAELHELVVFELNAIEADGERANVFEACGIEMLELPDSLLEGLRDAKESQPPPLVSEVPQELPPWLLPSQPVLMPAAAL